MDQAGCDLRKYKSSELYGRPERTPALLKEMEDYNQDPSEKPASPLNQK